MPTTCAKASFRVERRGWLVGWLFIINSRGLARLLFIRVHVEVYDLTHMGNIYVDYVTNNKILNNYRKLE